MRIGISGFGLGPTGTGAVVKTAAQAAERAGFSTFWMGEHVVMFADDVDKNYPHSSETSKSRSILMDPNVVLTDPIVALTWAAAATSRIEVGSSIIILPQRNPVILAKELSTLDSFSGGRVVLGVGTGWSVPEYRAVNADWPQRGRRMDEYVGALRVLWRENPSTFHGETIEFDGAHLFPKPVRNDIPIIFGGESDRVILRTARFGEGWMPVKPSPEEFADKVARLRGLTREFGRDPNALRVIAPITTRTTVDDLKRFRDAGATEFKLACFGELPVDEAGLSTGLEELALRFVAPAGDL